jgi:hypothetical protein
MVFGFCGIPEFKASVVVNISTTNDILQHPVIDVSNPKYRFKFMLQSNVVQIPGGWFGSPPICAGIRTLPGRLIDVIVW